MAALKPECAPFPLDSFAVIKKTKKKKRFSSPSRFPTSFSPLASFHGDASPAYFLVTARLGCQLAATFSEKRRDTARGHGGPDGRSNLGTCVFTFSRLLLAARVLTYVKAPRPTLLGQVWPLCFPSFESRS